jgi:hypothetical protein
VVQPAAALADPSSWSRSCKVIGPPDLLTNQPNVEVVADLAIGS